ncbi:MAG: hypothetical protein ACI97B_002560 [Verrucomicrobiales bacterium]|jgi:hypothetical protein
MRNLFLIAGLWSLAAVHAAPHLNQKSEALIDEAGRARLQGVVESGGPADVDVYWGPSDGDNTPANWAHRVRLSGVKEKEPFFVDAENLVYGQSYFYRCYASLDNEGAWAPATSRFTTLKPRVAAPGANDRPVLPVTSGLVCRFDATEGVAVDEEGVVQVWKDLSGNAHHARLMRGIPKVVAGEQNAKPFMQFRTETGACVFNLDGPFFVEQQFVVVRSPHPTWNKDGCILGRRWARSSSYRLSGNSTRFWGDQYPNAVSKNGIGIKDRPFDLAPITDFMILKIDVNHGDMSDNSYQIGMGDMGSCDFDVMEILGYQSRLSSADEELVGGYLAAKYGIPTSYAECRGQVPAASLVPAPATAGPTSATFTASLDCPGSMYDVQLFWGPRNGGADADLWAHSISLGSYTNVMGEHLSATVEGLTPGMTYAFTFQATNSLDHFWAASPLSFQASPPEKTQPLTLPVKQGLACWYDAAVGLTTKPDGTIKSWNDQSGKAHHAIPGGGSPLLATNAIHGKPAVEIRKSWFALDGTFFAKEHYLVIRSPEPQWSGASGLLGRLKGRGSSYNTWGGETGFWTDVSPAAVTRNGIVLPGVGFDCSPLTSFMILKIVTNDANPTEASYAIGNNDGLSSCDFDVAEIIGYESILSPAEEALVGGYLAAKYGIQTTYPPPLAPPVDVVKGASPYADGQHAGSMWLLTTPDGAHLPATAREENVPVLVRLNKDWFNFSEAKAEGEDIRFASSDGTPLAYQIDHWDAHAGTADIWVRVPQITGNARQEIKVYWGRANADSASNGAAVFNASNGYLSVWHMDDPAMDVGTAASRDNDTTPTSGMIGSSRRFSGGKGISGGKTIRNYPFASSPHSSEAWFKAEQLHTTLLDWGNSDGVRLRLLSTPGRMAVASRSGTLEATRLIPKSEWVQVVHTYDGQYQQIYVNGLADTRAPAASTMRILTPVQLQIGNGFIGDMDEVRISNVARSANWVKLQFENQKTHQTLVGPMVQPDQTFSVSQQRITLSEGQHQTITARAGGAQKLYWIIKDAASETIAEVDRFTFTLDAGRVTGDQSYTLQLKAVFAESIKTIDIPVTIQEAIPDPVFTLDAPAQWDGREKFEVLPRIANLAAMQANGADELNIDWTLPPMVEHKAFDAQKLILLRARNSGTMAVTATISNGGQPVSQTVHITVTEPKRDAWVERIPEMDEKPVDGQFFARDDKNEGTLYYRGSLDQPADAVFLKLYADDQLIKTDTQAIPADKAYAFTVRLQSGLIKYKVAFGTQTGGAEKVVHTVTNLVCGDAFLIEGQSNALATDTGEQSPPVTSEWIRSYGRAPGNITDTPGNLWCSPVWKAQKGEKAELGWWGMELARQLVESQKIPLFIVNGAVGGTRIDQHQRNDTDPTDLKSIYGRMLWRVQQAKLTHGIRGVLWHQGEADQGLDGPDGGYGWEFYQPYFLEMSADWKQDMPNLRHYYLFQIWPNACSQGGGHGDRLREVQRNLPRLYSNMDIMPTLGIQPPGSCHYPLIGWTEFARLMQPLIERDTYGRKVTESITAPNLQQAVYTRPAKDAIALRFDQPITWNDAMADQFFLDNEKGKVASGAVNGSVLTLKLKEPSTAKTIAYIKELSWSPDHLVIGANGIAALTFCDVPIENEESLR